MVSHASKHDPLTQADKAFLRRHLDGVSRTFALTIPQLPEALWPVVANAYLLCRIADTIEDDPGFDTEATSEFSQRFIAILETAEYDPESSDHLVSATADKQRIDELTLALSEHLTQASNPAEHVLISELPEVIANYRQYNAEQRDALLECVRTMSQGMAEFQRGVSLQGLTNMQALDRYCYYVAGVVGECLTRLFCEYSPAMAAHREQMMGLAVSFGQGLQMTNILKDVWDDHRRGVSWLPRQEFVKRGLTMEDLKPGACQAEFLQVMRELTVIANQHLWNALRYTLLIPSKETGIRNFCLWAIGMAVLTLRKIYFKGCYSSSNDVKISRNSVKLTMLLSRLSAPWDWMLKLEFKLLSGVLSRPQTASRH